MFLLFARSSLAEGRQANRLAEDRKGSAMRTFYTLRWMVRFTQDHCVLLWNGITALFSVTDRMTSMKQRESKCSPQKNAYTGFHRAEDMC